MTSPPDTAAHFTVLLDALSLPRKTTVVDVGANPANEPPCVAPEPALSSVSSRCQRRSPLWTVTRARTSFTIMPLSGTAPCTRSTSTARLR